MKKIIKISDIPNNEKIEHIITSLRMMDPDTVSAIYEVVMSLAAAQKEQQLNQWFDD